MAANGGPRARVLYDYEVTEDNELALVAGETLFEVEQIDEGALCDRVNSLTAQAGGQRRAPMAVRVSSQVRALI